MSFLVFGAGAGSAVAGAAPAAAYEIVLAELVPRRELSYVAACRALLMLMRCASTSRWRSGSLR